MNSTSNSNLYDSLNRENRGLAITIFFTGRIFIYRKIQKNNLAYNII